jgi:ACT domain-containing protein
MARQWDLSSRQRELAELIQLGDPETGEHYTVVEACEKVGVARSTYYEWLKKDEFVAYMDYLADMALKARIGKYDRILDRLATSSENEKTVLDAINILYKRIGKFKTDSNVNVNINDEKSISEKSLDELKRELEALKAESET